jgi:hypothetical protein
MALYYGKHKVRDYDHWRPFFDSDQKRIESVGAKCINVLRDTADPNDVAFIFDVPDFTAFMNLMQDPETQDIMQQAGVVTEPVIFRLESFITEPSPNLN